MMSALKTKRPEVKQNQLEMRNAHFCVLLNSTELLLTTLSLQKISCYIIF